MKTISSLCATGSTTALFTIGIAIVRKEKEPQASASHDFLAPSAGTDMSTAIASYHANSAPLSSPFALPTSTIRQPRRLASDNNCRPPADSKNNTRKNNNGRSRASSSSQHPHKRHSLTPSSSGFSAGMDRSALRQDEQRGVVASASGSETPSSGGPPSTTWLRRLSSSLSTSRDSSRTPASRPGSAAVSYTNASFALSHTGSTTPIFPDNTPPSHTASLPPNKLVKRTSSLSSANGSPGSRIPVFRRPATSHQRSATLQGTLSSSDRFGRMSLRTPSPDARNGRYQSYFTPRITAEQTSASKRRGSTGIPNPIRRVYPDRKYTPVLASTRDIVRRPAVELDDGESDYEVDMEASRSGSDIAASSASSPFPPPTTHFEASTSPRRSFSIGDLLSAGPEPLWRRPSFSRGPRTWSSRSMRKSKPRVVSAPQTPMGGAISKLTGHDCERPAKRRDLTDPRTTERSIYSSSSSVATHEIDLNLGGDSTAYVPYAHESARSSEPPSRAQTPDHYRLPPAITSTSTSKPVRVSATQSEIPSTIGSDSESRSVGDNSTDYQSDTYYDSFPTRTTRSSSGRRGPHIETIFDESPPNFSSGRSTKLRDFLSDSNDDNGRYSTIEEEGSIVSTPVRSLRNKSVTSTPSARPGAPHLFTSSPPAMNFMPDPDEIDWDAPEDDKASRGLGIHQHSSMPTFTGDPTRPGAPFRFGPALRPANSHSANSTPLRNGYSPMDRANLFDWAEPQPSPSHASNSPPRPRTVHGKKDQDSRGSRPAGRRPPSGMHARSHSVPVVPDLDGKRHNVVANKFGTWGVGSKGVTEDWNEDFDFDDPSLPAQGLDQDERRIDSGHEMFVPKSIREQQQNVVANIGLLREWGLLIEELKELRIRAAKSHMLQGTYAQAWREVDAMIELADQETEEQTLEPRPTPPSSPGFDISAFEDSTESKASVRLSDHDLIAAESLAQSARAVQPPHSTPIVNRPRKDSELVAQNVIAALQSKRSATDRSAAHSMASSHRKVPFDTATLRHIVPYVNGLKRKVKDALRETEGLYSSPHRRRSPDDQRCRDRREGEDEDGEDNDEPAFRSIFSSPREDDVTSQRQSRRQQAVTDNDGSESPLFDQSGNLTNRLQRLSFPS